MNKLITLSLAFLWMASSAAAQLSLQNLLTENRQNPIGLDEKTPRFTWQLVAPARNTLQTAYELRVGADEAALTKGKDLLWSSGKITSSQSVLVPYGGYPDSHRELASGRRYHWQVRVWDNHGNDSGWSAPAFWQTALFHPADWKAQWIAPGYAGDTLQRFSPYFRKGFSTKKKVKSATAYVTAHGLYEAWLNGQRIGDAFLTPGWTSYSTRLQYQVFDVTPMLASGNNAIGVVLGSGWYRGFIGFSGQHDFYGKDIALLFQLDITYTDGSTETIASDGSWKCSTGSIVSSEIYHGEAIDARLEKAGWNTAGFSTGVLSDNESGWSAVKVMDFDKKNLLATYNEPIKKHETFQPLKIFKTPKGEQIIDFGQNLVGWVQVRASGKAGDKITLYHAEVLDKEGNFYTDNLRPAKQMNTFILKGGGEEFFEPHFTFQGFRYVRVVRTDSFGEGFPGELRPENFTAVALYSDMPQSGNFECSNPLLEQLQHNIRWGQNGNFLDVPTDCPQRDERLGWTGDAQAFSRTATFNRNVHPFFAKWLKDVAADQRSDGSVPFVIPNVLGQGAAGSTGWADAATIIPWNMYLVYGDVRILENQFESMKKWVAFMESNSTDFLWNKGFHFGDWLFYRPDDDNDGSAAVTDKYLIAQCFFAHSTELTMKAAEVLGKKEDAARYAALLKNVKNAFLNEYVTPGGRLVSGTQTAYVLALNFDMLPESKRHQAAQRLADNVKNYGNHLTTGFLGTPHLCHVLSRFGHDPVAFDLLMQESYPSWLYPVKMGATTIWERWDGIKPDSTFQTPNMNSFNHYAYGAIGDWMYRHIAGIELAAPGYKRLIIKPHVGGKLTSAGAELQTYYGKVSSRWRIEGGKMWLDVEIPANCDATILLPAPSIEAVTEGGKRLVEIGNVMDKTVEGVIELGWIGSGSYHFSWEVGRE